MRTRIIAAAALALFANAPGAEACGLFGGQCQRPVVVWPLYTQAGQRIGTVEAPVRRVPRLEVSRFTGQPITVIYDNPTSRPGSVEPYLHLEALPHVKPSSTIGAYPVGY